VSLLTECVDSLALQSPTYKPRATLYVFSHAKVEKVFTVRVKTIFALVTQHSERKYKSSLSSSPN